MKKSKLVSLSVVPAAIFALVSLFMLAACDDGSTGDPAGNSGTRPSQADFYGTWVAEVSELTTVITESTVTMLSVVYTINSWEELTNTNTDTKAEYPFGYKISLTASTIQQPIVLIDYLHIDKNKRGSALTTNPGYESMTIYTKRTTNSTENYPTPHGKLTITGCDSYEGNYVYFSCVINGNATISSIYNLELGSKMGKIENGTTEVPLYRMNPSPSSSNDLYIAYEGNDSITALVVYIFEDDDGWLSISDLSNITSLPVLDYKTYTSGSFSNGNLSINWLANVLLIQNYPFSDFNNSMMGVYAITSNPETYSAASSATSSSAGQGHILNGNTVSWTTIPEAGTYKILISDIRTSPYRYYKISGVYINNAGEGIADWDTKDTLTSIN